MDNTATTSRRTSSLRLQPLALGLAVSLMAAPVNATITLPDDPLTTGARVPPNVLFLLDDSGSMAFEAMPDDSIGSNWNRQTYVNNAVYYNPNRTYTPWLKADGTPMPSTPYEAVYGDFNLASGDTINLFSSASCRRYNRNNNATSGVMSGNNGTQVCGGIQTFYVPKDANRTSVTSRDQVYRYQIHTDGRVVRSEYGTRTTGEANRECGTRSSDWGSCTYATPTGRTEEQERANYANWFSFHRTRMKAAKAGAGVAFSQVGRNVRVGFRTIWGRDVSGGAANSPTNSVPIPVGHNNGLFDNPNGSNGANNNRTRWYDRLYATIGYNGTPLHDALNSAGSYYSSSGANGPYGPESGNNQLSCRQNFTILTTDGYWNNRSIDVGNQDNSNGDTITGVNGASYRYVASAPYRDVHSNTLADVAMRYWKSDLRTNLTNNVPTTAANPAFWQHMVTFGISLGVTGRTGFRSVADVPANYASWPDPNDAEDGDRIDDLLHAAVNGRGDFVSASDPEAFANGLSAALAAITERTGSFSNVAANSTSVDGGTRLYQASYVSGTWTGELAAYPVSTSGVAAQPSWRASAGIPASGRRLFTADDTGTNAVAFPGGISDTRRALLARSGAIDFPVSGVDNAAYLAGDTSREERNGGNLRNRSTLLGDIVSSSPAYSADTDTVFVGSNDGMLHAFNAANGNELFGFLPGGLDWNALGGLSRPDYSHRYFVDGPIVVTTRQQTPGRNILVGTLGKGGHGLYALDVTTPSSFSANDFKWEVRSLDGAMGLVQSRPVIGRLNNGTTAVITANGINSGNGQAALILLDVGSGDTVRILGTGVGSAVEDSPQSNGLTSAVGWDADGNGTVDYVYGGDMLGNVWKFDVSSSNSALWSIVDNAPLFTATDAAGNRQPITAGLTLALHPRTYQPWLFFGTGRLLTPGDMSSRTVQSLYGMVDDGVAKSRSGAQANLTRRQTVVSGTMSGYPVRAFERQSALPANSKGWYLDLLAPAQPPAVGASEGERVISDAQLFGEVLIVSSVIPTADACQADGRGYLNALDAFTGTSTGPSLFDLDGDGVYEDETIGDLPVGSVDLGVGMPTLAEVLRGLAVVGGSSGDLGDVRIRETRNVGRVSWREVLTN